MIFRESQSEECLTQEGLGEGTHDSGHLGDHIHFFHGLGWQMSKIDDVTKEEASLEATVAWGIGSLHHKEVEGLNIVIDISEVEGNIVQGLLGLPRIGSIRCGVGSGVGSGVGGRVGSGIGEILIREVDCHGLHSIVALVHHIIRVVEDVVEVLESSPDISILEVNDNVSGFIEPKLVDHVSASLILLDVVQLGALEEP